MWEEQLKVAIQAGVKAVKPILEVYNSPFDVEIKDDQSPVTLADKTADYIIRKYLFDKFPNYAFLTEESFDDKSRLNNDYVWIIDPVDGTKNFIARNGQFCTHIALAFKHEIVVGVVIVPLTGEIYYASKNKGAFYRHNNVTKRIYVNDKTDNLIVLRSLSHATAREDEVIAKHHDKIIKQEKWGSSLKACRIARGLAELSYRLSEGTKEWDTAVGQIIVEEAGGIFLDPNKKRLTYNRKDTANHDGYVICNRIENFLL